MKTNKKQQPIPMAAFLDAAVTLFKCTPEDVEIRMIEENHEAFVIYEEQPYKVSTWEILRRDVSDMLTDPEQAEHTNPYIWIEATQHSVDLDKILPDLVHKLDETDKIQRLQLVLVVTLLSKDKNQYRAFWESLSNIDRVGNLFGPAIVCVTERYDAETIIDDVTQLLIINGQTVYNRVEVVYSKPYTSMINSDIRLFTSIQ